MTTKKTPAKKTEKKTEVAEQAPGIARVPVENDGLFANLLDSAKFDHLWRLGNMYADCDLVPEVYRGNPANCAIACDMAIRLGIQPVAFMQSSYIIHGKPGIEAKLAVAMLIASGSIVGRPRYELEGDDDKPTACTCFVTDRRTGEEISHRLTWGTVEREGWLSKSGSKWKTDPALMFRYRSAARLIRLHFPEVLEGFYLKEELDEASTIEGATVHSPVGSATSRTEYLKAQMKPAGSLEAPKPERKPVESKPDPAATAEPQRPQVGRELTVEEQFELENPM